MSNHRHGIALVYALGIWALGCAHETSTRKPQSTTLEIATATPSAAEPQRSKAPSDNAVPSANTQPDNAQPKAAPNAAARPSASPPAAQNELGVLPLPSDRSFVERPLGIFAPERYTTWGEHSKIHVGKSHLQELDVSADERLLYVSSGAEDSVRVYERKSRRLLAQIPIAGSAPFEQRALLAWPSNAPNTEALFVVGTQHGIDLVSTQTKDAVARLDTRPVHNLRWSPDTTVLMATASDTETQTSVLSFYRRTERGLQTIAVQHFAERVDSCALSADNRLLALSHYPSGDVRVVDLLTRTDLLRTPGPQYSGDVAFSPDGRYLAVGGAGLLVIDLLNPARRAFYSQLQNNIGHVRFSPSGDAVAASSFDGRIRIFALNGESGSAATSAPPAKLQLTLLTALRHAGTANVYDFVFTQDGALISVSGDQTLREFRSKAQTPKAQKGSAEPQSESRRFRTLDQWREAQPTAALAWPSPAAPPMANGHYLPPALSGPARAAKLRPGTYACKISQIYKLRDCYVWRDAQGHTQLQFARGNLLQLDAVVFDDGPALRFEAWPTEESSLLQCRGCERQPLHGLLRGDGNSFKGVLMFRNYYDPYVLPPAPALDVKLEEGLDRFPIELQYRGPLPQNHVGQSASAAHEPTPTR
jgi:hypothetical protein